MFTFQLKSFRPESSISEPHFFILCKGLNSGKPQKTPFTNSFVVIFQNEEDCENVFWITYSLWQSKFWHRNLCGSVIPFFQSIANKGVLPITDPRMTRFMITLEQGVELVWHAFEDMVGGEIYVKKIPSMKITDIAKAVAHEARHEFVGIRPGEKLHEQMIGHEDALHTYEYADYYKILPAIHNWSLDPKRINDGHKVDADFTYSSDNNPEWMSVEALRHWIDENNRKVGNS
jgi:hypothetical protein